LKQEVGCLGNVASFAKVLRELDYDLFFAPLEELFQNAPDLAM
jgi:hypothetical protein